MLNNELKKRKTKTLLESSIDSALVESTMKQVLHMVWVCRLFGVAGMIGLIKL